MDPNDTYDNASLAIDAVMSKRTNTAITLKRIQLRRIKGWRMPPNTVPVSRPHRFGNPVRVGSALPVGLLEEGEKYDCVTQAQAVDIFRRWRCACPRFREQIRDHLYGYNLACWCKLCADHSDGKPAGLKCEACEPCHADVLLEIANG